MLSVLQPPPQCIGRNWPGDDPVPIIKVWVGHQPRGADQVKPRGRPPARSPWWREGCDNWVGDARRHKIFSLFSVYGTETSLCSLTGDILSSAHISHFFLLPGKTGWPAFSYFNESTDSAGKGDEWLAFKWGHWTRSRVCLQFHRRKHTLRFYPLIRQRDNPYRSPWIIIVKKID